MSANNWASARFPLGKFEVAQALQEKVHQARRRLQGPGHPDTTVAARNLAATLEALGDTEGAKRLLDEIERHRRPD